MAAPDLAALTGWLNATYPTRDWDQRCAQLVWNVLYYVAGAGDESRIIPYDPALAAYRASVIESLDPHAAPPGAIHFWDYPAPDGHVAIEWYGGGTCLMTTSSPDTRLGSSYGLRSVAAYTASKPTRYLGWSRAYGANRSICDYWTPDTTPDSEDDTMKLRATRNPDTGVIYVTNPVTGRRWHVPNPDYWTLLQAMKLVEPLQDWPDNVIQFEAQLLGALGAADADVEGAVASLNAKADAALAQIEKYAPRA